MKKERQIFKDLVELGLDINTGTSPEISIEVLEEHSGLRLVSNGSRIIRRDSLLFSLFDIRYYYVGKSLASVEFRGYKTNTQIQDKMYKDLTKYQSKVIVYQELITNTLGLLKEQQKTSKDFSVEDLYEVYLND